MKEKLVFTETQGLHEIVKVIKEYAKKDEFKPIISIKGNPNSVGTSSGGCQIIL